MLSSQTVYVLKPLQLGGGIDGKYCSRFEVELTFFDFLCQRNPPNRHGSGQFILD
jgi:hypothetical protein